MKISTFFYILRQGFANIRRNILFSLASIGTIISCLFLFGIIYAVVVNFQSGMQELESTVTISVFFDEDTSDETIQLIGEQIRTLDYVNTMDFVSADQAWDNFVKQNYDNPQAAKDAFGDDNPLKNAASYEVTLKDVSKQPEFVAFAQGLSGVRKVKSSDVTADSITTLSSLVGYASIGIVVILMLVSIFLKQHYHDRNHGAQGRDRDHEAHRSDKCVRKGAVHHRGCHHRSCGIGDTVGSSVLYV